MTQAAAAEVLQIDQPKVSALVRGRLAGFSLDRLVRFLVLLGSEAEIVVKPRVRATGRARVMVAGPVRWGRLRVPNADALRKERGASRVQHLGGVADVIERVSAGNGGQCATALLAFMAIAATWFLQVTDSK